MVLNNPFTKLEITEIFKFRVKKPVKKILYVNSFCHTKQLFSIINKIHKL